MSNKDEAPSDLIRARDVGGFDIWSLPSFDPPCAGAEPEPVEEPPAEMEEVPLDEVQPLTLEELETIRQEAYNEGFAAGKKTAFAAPPSRFARKPRRRWPPSWVVWSA